MCFTGCSGQHTFGTVTHWLPTPLSDNILNVLHAQYLEHNVILTLVCNGKYLHLEKEGLALSFTSHEILEGNLTSVSYSIMEFLGGLNMVTVPNISWPIFIAQCSFSLLPSL